MAVDLVEEKDLADEIDRADGFKEGIYTAMVNIDKCCKAPPTSAPPSSTVDLFIEQTQSSYQS